MKTNSKIEIKEVEKENENSITEEKINDEKEEELIEEESELYGRKESKEINKLEYEEESKEEKIKENEEYVNETNEEEKEEDETLLKEEINNEKKEEEIEEEYNLFELTESNEKEEYIEKHEEEYEIEKEEETKRILSIEIPDEKLLSLVISLSKGMSETEKVLCSKALENKQTEVIEKVYSIFEENKGKAIELKEDILNFFSSFNEIDGFVAGCNVLSIPALIEKIFSEDGLVEIFQTAIDNVHECFEYTEKMSENIKKKRL